MCSVNAILLPVLFFASHLYGLVLWGVSAGSSGAHVCSSVSFDDGWRLAGESFLEMIVPDTLCLVGSSSSGTLHTSRQPCCLAGFLQLCFGKVYSLSVSGVLIFCPWMSVLCLFGSSAVAL